MKHRPHDPLRLDVAAFTAESGDLAGTWPVAGLPRLAELQVSLADGAPLVDSPDVHWHAVGWQQPLAGGTPEIWLDLDAHCHVQLQCQRCLAPVGSEVVVARRFRFVHGEEQAAALDEEIEEEVLALARSLDLRELIEDELLLALPLVPRHERCPAPPPMQFGELETPEETRENPFAALAALRKPGEGG